MNRCHHVLVKPCQKQVMKEMKAEIKMVPRRPKYLFSGVESQQPITPQQSYTKHTSGQKIGPTAASEGGKGTYIWGTVHEAKQPLVVAHVLGNANLRWEKQVRAVDDGFVHLSIYK